MSYTQMEMWPKPVVPPSDDLLAHLRAVRDRDDDEAAHNRGIQIDKLYSESERPDMCLVMEALGIYGQSG
jgi:hypothetical protein